MYAKYSAKGAPAYLKSEAYDAIHTYPENLALQECYVQTRNKYEVAEPLPEAEVSAILEHARQNPCSKPLMPTPQIIVPQTLLLAQELIEKVGMKQAEAFLTPPPSEDEEPEVQLQIPGLKTIRVSTAEMKRIRFLWPGMLSFGRQNLFCGNPDHGKSLASIDVAARATTGANWPNAANNNGPVEVLIIAAEDDLEDTIAPRLQAAGADLTKVHYVESVVHDIPVTKRGKKAQVIRQLRLDEDIKAMEATLKQNPAIRLIIIDPISSYLGRAKMMDEQSVRDVLNPLTDLAKRTGVCILSIMHLNKKIDLDAVNRVGGAMAFVGIPRLAWIFAKKPKEEEEILDEGEGDLIRPPLDNTIYMMRLKGNIIRSDAAGLTFTTEAKPLKIEDGIDMVPYVEWGGPTTKTLEDLSAKKKHNEAQRTRQDSKKEQVETWLLEYLADGEKQYDGKGGIKEQAEQLHDAKTGTVKAASYSLGIIKKSRMVDKVLRYFWSLPPDDTVEVEM